jgi:hypothetical protein
MTNQRETPSWWGRRSRNLSWLEPDNFENSEPPNDPQEQTRRARLKRLACRIHGLGPAPLFHLLHDLSRGAPFPSTIEEYASLPANFIRDRFLPPFVIGKDQ